MSKSILIFSIIIILLMIGMGVRLTGLDKIDLYCDEATATEISKSLIKYGELNNLKQVPI